MNNTGRSIVYFLAGIVFTLLLAWLGWMYYWPKHQSSTSADVMLKNIRKVVKMITVEGEFSNVVSHSDFIGFDWGPFKKNVILKVNAKVSAGYDLERLDVLMDHRERRIIISNLPKASIISIEPDIQYFDMNQGWFNGFSKDELTELNTMAKDLITLKAYNSELMEQAEQQGFEMLEVIRLMAESGGWKVVFQDERPIIHDH